MDDILSERPVTIDTYATFVQTERKAETPVPDDQWDTERAALLDQEAIEFMGQHGPGGILLAPAKYRDQFSEYTKPYQDINQFMSDELSDLLWYSFDIAVHHGLDPGRIASLALSEHVGAEIHTSATFQAMQDKVISSISDIKMQIESIDNPGTFSDVALQDSPLQVFAAAHLRLIATLQSSEQFDTDLELALGDYINILTYIAKDRFNINIEDIARYNVFKLRDRRKYGKKIGHLFNEFDQLPT